MTKKPNERKREYARAYHKERYQKDREYRAKHDKASLEWHKRRRQEDAEYRTRSNKVSAERIRHLREDPKYKAKERKITYAHRRLCYKNDPEYRAKSIKAGSEWHKRRFQNDSEYRARRNEYCNKRQKSRYQSDPLYRLCASIGAAMRYYLRRGKGDNTLKILSSMDYDISELKYRCERLFYPRADGLAMSWDNYGLWHIDHIIPIAWFKKYCPFIKPEDLGFRMCWKLENLQPMWGPDNIKKGSKL